VQPEKPKPSANLSLFSSDTLFASADDSPTFDLFAPSVSTLVTVSSVLMHIQCLAKI